MRALIIGAAAFALSGCIIIDADTTTVPAASIEGPEDYEGPLVKRTALVVSTMDRALTVYRDLLGFQLNSLTQSGPNSYSYEVFALPRDVPIRFATLNSGPDQQRSLALIESIGIDPYATEAPRPAALVVNANGRFDAILAGARAMGLTVIEPRPLISQTQGEGVEGAFLDHDGHLIVIFQFPQADQTNRM
jgi:catechol 2,3-dioxygenase-like lactoylglutathione lyase family enzyme